MKIRPKLYSDFKLVDRDQPTAKTTGIELLSSKYPSKMFRNKRNFSILVSPTSRAPLATPTVQPSPSKRMRLTTSFRNSTLLRDHDTTPSAPPEIHKSPVFQRQDELPTFLGERVSKIFLGQPESISISNGFFDHASRPLSRTVTPTTSVEQTEEQRADLVTHELLKSKDTPPPTPIDKPESIVDILTREKADLEMEVKKLDSENNMIFQAISENKENCNKIQRMSFALEDQIDISLRGFCQVRNLLNDIYNPGLEVTKNCGLILEETKRRHSSKLEKLLLCLNDRIETSEKATTAKEKELEHTIGLHQRTLIALENQEREERAKLAEQAASKIVEEPEIQQNDEPELDPIVHSSLEKTMQKSICAADKCDITEDDCVIIDCDKPDDSANEPTNLLAETPEIQEIEGINNDWVANHSENNGTCDDEEETDIEESKEDEVEGSFTPQQAQRV